MVNSGPQSKYGVSFHRKQVFHTAVTAVFILILLSLGGLLFINWRDKRKNDGLELQVLWAEGDYRQVFSASRTALENKPMDYFLLVMNGFSAYQLAVAQTGSSDVEAYIDACIWSLRKALLLQDEDGRVYYVLGKAYYYKGTSYADLAVSYLEKARRLSFLASDIPEYLGLSYASLRDYRGSVAAFTQSLGDNTSDILLLAIAKSYAELGDYDSARAYLLRCIESSLDYNTINAARLLLGDVLKDAGDAAGAEIQYLAIIAENGENAEAHFRLGELYFDQKDEIRARAEWRRAERINPAHAGARARFNR
ncbi:hypothetical protein AGMMS49928_01620 [Spirochaetia bacterium]|nr:hypothetical protein AGMMS49928_01620 [Spirochaetia bacterium]